MEKKVLDLTEQIVKEHQITCLMITHDMNSALKLGNRTIMMNEGKIIFDVSGKQREKITVENLVDKFKEVVGRQLSNDEMLLKM